MINCDTFRKRFEADLEDAAVLGHLRTCDRCLDFAANVDPDVMFRALGGSELVPPGGVDAFVGDVMRQIRVRETEHVVSTPRVVAWPRRLALAATVAAAISATLLFTRGTPQSTIAPTQVAAVSSIAPITTPRLATRPVVESYDSQNATIVEVPSEAADDVQIVMVFDENLPADL